MKRMKNPCNGGAFLCTNTFRSWVKELKATGGTLRRNNNSNTGLSKYQKM